MEIDPEIECAIAQAVKELDQSEKVAHSLIAWVKEQSNRDISDTDKHKHLEQLHRTLDIEVVEP